jgi:NMD protein affecting ribosome stability and mRNA decay
MSNLCPVCSKELEPAITFGGMTFEICFDCNFITEPKKYTRYTGSDVDSDVV